MSFINCFSVAPIAKPEASVMIPDGVRSIGCVRSVACIRFFLHSLNAVSVSADHLIGVLSFFIDPAVRS